MKRRTFDFKKVLALTFLMVMLACLLSFVAFHLFSTAGRSTGQDGVGEGIQTIVEPTPAGIQEDASSVSQPMQDPPGQEVTPAAAPHPDSLNPSDDVSAMPDDVDTCLEPDPDHPDTAALQPDATVHMTASPVETRLEDAGEVRADDEGTLHVDGAGEPGPDTDTDTDTDTDAVTATSEADGSASPTGQDDSPDTHGIIITGSDEPVYDDDFFSTSVENSDKFEFYIKWSKEFDLTGIATANAGTEYDAAVAGVVRYSGGEDIAEADYSNFELTGDIADIVVYV